MAQPVRTSSGGDGDRVAFRHWALLYADDDEYLTGTVPFIRAALEDEQPVLVTVGEDKAGLLRSELDDDSEAVQFADMAELGRNPARLLAVWREFVDRAAGDRREARGIAEPVWPGRSAEEVVECQHHEALINLAFADAPAWSLLCHYDAARLDEQVLEAARASHPLVMAKGVKGESDRYEGPPTADDVLGPALREPAVMPERFELAVDRLGAARRWLGDRAARMGLGKERIADLILSATEVATNSLRYAPGRAYLLVWRDEDALLCEVRDWGRIADPLVGRRRPGGAEAAGRGLWLVNQLCDLVQVRSGFSGTTVRMQMHCA